MRLTDRFNQIMAERGLSLKRNPVPAKLALPIIENATLEQNDELQDLWTHLLVSAVRADTDRTTRNAFVDVAKQLEPADARFLKIVGITTYLRAYLTMDRLPMSGRLRATTQSLNQKYKAYLCLLLKRSRRRRTI